MSDSMSTVRQLAGSRRFRAGILLLVLPGLLGALVWGSGPLDNTPNAQRQRQVPGHVPTPQPLVLKPLSPEEAMSENSAIPFASEPLETAFGFVAQKGPLKEIDAAAALDCLTAAVYYEAGSENAHGQRAVAQVVLNRVRHPAFPASICGVVYQGSDRATGCQFTFTCDGSLARRPTATGWARARAVAKEALRGEVERSVGMATHYHANYVVPYWAPSLAKIAAVGAHIFYRWPGTWGKRFAFNQAYAGEDAAPQLAGVGLTPEMTDSSEEVLIQIVNLDPLQHVAPSPLAPTLTRSNPVKADEGARTLAADELPSSLILDTGPVVISSAK